MNLPTLEDSDTIMEIDAMREENEKHVALCDLVRKVINDPGTVINTGLLGALTKAIDEPVTIQDRCANVIAGIRDIHGLDKS